MKAKDLPHALLTAQQEAVGEAGADWNGGEQFEWWECVSSISIRKFL